MCCEWQPPSFKVVCIHNCITNNREEEKLFLIRTYSPPQQPDLKKKILAETRFKAADAHACQRPYWLDKSDWGGQASVYSPCSQQLMTAGQQWTTSERGPHCLLSLLPSADNSNNPPPPHSTPRELIGQKAESGVEDQEGSLVLKELSVSNHVLFNG